MEAHLSITTIKTIKDLKSFEWFNKIGINDTDDCVILNSWDEAIQSCSAPEWEDLCFEAAVQYRNRIAEYSNDRLSKWNDVVKMVKPYAISVFDEKCAMLMFELKLPKVFKDTVEWDILHLLIESEYSDIYPPGFYAQNAYCYAQGHFPCGWEGDFPSGKLIIF